jgi:hypothetical protein
MPNNTQRVTKQKQGTAQPQQNRQNIGSPNKRAETRGKEQREKRLAAHTNPRFGAPFIEEAKRI